MDEAYPPGTVRLVDLHSSDNNNDIAHVSDGVHRDILLVPAPSEDPDDPLNWSLRRKRLATACIFVGRYTFTVGIASAAVYSVLEPIERATGLTLGDLNAGTGYMAIMVWVPYTKTNGQWIASKILQ
ncbi:MAG: hypothetical protein Q9203_007696, partial [Teloschistes exilis]